MSENVPFFEHKMLKFAKSAYYFKTFFHQHYYGDCSIWLKIRWNGIKKRFSQFWIFKFCTFCNVFAHSFSSQHYFPVYTVQILNAYTQKNGTFLKILQNVISYFLQISIYLSFSPIKFWKLKAPFIIHIFLLTRLTSYTECLRKDHPFVVLKLLSKYSNL